MFTVAGIGAWLPQFHERFSGMTEKQATEHGRRADHLRRHPRRAVRRPPRRPLRDPGEGRARRDPRLLHLRREHVPHPLVPAGARGRVGVLPTARDLLDHDGDPRAASRHGRRRSRPPARRGLRRVQPRVDPVRRGGRADHRRRAGRRLEPAGGVPDRLAAGLRRRVDLVPRPQPSRRRRDEDLRSGRARHAAGPGARGRGASRRPHGNRRRTRLSDRPAKYIKYS